MYVNFPRGFRDRAALEERRYVFETVPSIQPLRVRSTELAGHRGHATVIPQFDPADAGVNARLLILLEAPGPMTNAGNVRPGSEFTSADSDDKTAENLWRLRADTGLD